MKIKTIGLLFITSFLILACGIESKNEPAKETSSPQPKSRVTTETSLKNPSAAPLIPTVQPVIAKGNPTPKFQPTPLEIVKNIPNLETDHLILNIRGERLVDQTEICVIDEFKYDLDDRCFTVDHAKDSQYVVRLTKTTTEPRIIVTRISQIAGNWTKEYQFKRSEYLKTGETIFKSEAENVQERIADYGLNEHSQPLFREHAFYNPFYRLTHRSKYWTAQLKEEQLSELKQTRKESPIGGERRIVEEQEAVNFDSLAENLFTGTLTQPTVRKKLTELKIPQLAAKDILKIRHLLTIEADGTAP